MSSPLSHFSYADSAKDKDGPQIGLLTKITMSIYYFKAEQTLHLRVVFLVTVILLTHVIFWFLVNIYHLNHFRFGISANRVLHIHEILL